MEVVLNGIHNFLSFVNDNWTMITAIFGLALVVSKKVKAYWNTSQEEKIAIAKAQIDEIMLKLVTEAEKDYLEWTKAGAVKRSQVIDQVFSMYPILSRISNQQEIIIWIDDAINRALKEMRKIFEENKKNSESEVEVEAEIKIETEIETEVE